MLRPSDLLCLFAGLPHHESALAEFFPAHGRLVRPLTVHSLSLADTPPSLDILYEDQRSKMRSIRYYSSMAHDMISF
jgi:hypothetical protein